MSNSDKNYIVPQGNQFKAFKELPRDKPIMMLNLLRFRKKAAYGDGQMEHEGTTGAEAYATYIREIGPISSRVGARIIWRGKPERMLIGPSSQESWDMIFVAKYPSVDAFLKMVEHPEYGIAVKHRRAAVEDSRLICTTDVEEGVLPFSKI